METKIPITWYKYVIEIWSTVKQAYTSPSIAYTLASVLATSHSIYLDSKTQKYSRLRCLLRFKGLVTCFYLG